MNSNQAEDIEEEQFQEFKDESNTNAILLLILCYIYIDWDAPEDVPLSKYWEEEWEDSNEMVNKIQSEIEKQSDQMQKP